MKRTILLYLIFNGLLINLILVLLANRTKHKQNTEEITELLYELELMLDSNQDNE